MIKQNEQNRASHPQWQELLQLGYLLFLSMSRLVHPPGFSTPPQMLGFLAKNTSPCCTTTLVYIPETLFAMASSSEGDPGEIDESLFDGYDGMEDEADDDDAESSMDLLIRFFQSLFKKVSKRAKKASRSVLPAVLSPQLVSFDGTLLLAFLCIAKAFLEVVCNLGGAVFIAILLLRVIWAAVSYFQSSGSSFGAAA